MLEGKPLTLVCGQNLGSNPEAMVEWRDPDGTVVASGASNFTNGGSEMALTFNSSTPSTLTDAGNWTCTVSVTGPNGEVLPLSPIVRTITVTVVGEYVEYYICSILYSTKFLRDKYFMDQSS